MKKSKMTKWSVILVVAGLAISLCGCGSSTKNAADHAMMESTTVADGAVGGSWNGGSFDDDFMVEEEMGAEDISDSVEQPKVQDDRKLIKTVDMNVETKEFDTFLSHIQARVTQLGGYMESMETYNGSKYSTYQRSRNAYMTIRVPKEQLDKFLNEVSEYSNVINRSENVKDVTLTYVDLESHKKVLLAEQDRLLELMQRAETIEDIITLESRLSNIRYQVESMEAQLRTYDNKVNYSTVTLQVQEVKELTPVEEKTVWEEITAGFGDNLERIGEGAKNLFIWFVVNIPFLCLWAILIVVIIVVCKTIRAKKNKNRMNNLPKVDNKTE